MHEECHKYISHVFQNDIVPYFPNNHDMQSAFNSIKDEGVIGFRVNYNDNDTDSFEKELARKFGVPYQHTKIFLKNGERVLKSPETWSKSRYIEEINNFLN